MSDDFAVCPKCGVLDANFIDLAECVRVPGMAICTHCLRASHRSEIRWLHVEYE